MQRLKTYLPTLLWISVAFSCAVASAQDTEFEFDTPDWRSEKMQLPLPFAPTMTFRGLDELRFSPGMFKGDREDFFSYVFVMSLEPETELDEKVIRKELLIYYRGLAQAVGKATKSAVDKFTLEMKTMLQATRLPEMAKEPAEYYAELIWDEPFVTRQSQKLRLEIQTFRFADSDRKYLFVCASPQPLAHDVWTKMRGFRKSLRIKSKVNEQK